MLVARPLALKRRDDRVDPLWLVQPIEDRPFWLPILGPLAQDVSVSKFGTTVLLATLFTFPASAETKAQVPELPRVSDARLAGEPNWMHVECKLATYVAPFEADCTITQAWLSLPRLATQSIAEAEKRAAKPWGADLTKACQSEAREKYTDPTRGARQQQYLSACKVRDAKAYLELLVQDLKKGEQTCHMNVVPQGITRFRQVDTNTWVNVRETHSDFPTGPCHLTTTETLWRKPGESYFWNFSDARSVGQSSSEACKKLEVRRTWTTFDHGAYEIPCRYVAP